MRLRLLAAVLLLAVSALTFSSLAPVARAAAPYYIASNICNSATTCSVTIPSAVYGDTLFVMVEYPYNTFGSLGDTFSTSLTQKATENVGTTYTSASVFVGVLSFSGQDQLTLTVTTSSTIEIQVVEKQGLFTDFVTSAKQSSGSGTSLSTASNSFSGYTYFCVAALGGKVGGTGGPVTFTAGAGYSLLGIVNATLGIAEYSSTVSSPTTFPATITPSAAWTDTGVCGARVHVSPANVWLVNFASNPSSVFNINQYKGSYVQVGYPSSIPSTYPTTVPEVEASLTGSSLLTVWVGPATTGGYFRTLIPSPTNNTFWLTSPSQEEPYTIAVQDLSGQFGAGSSIYVKLGTQVMASGYLDAGGTFATWVPPGSYTVEITSGPSTYAAPLSLPATGSSPQAPTVIQILKITAVGNCGVTCTVSYGAKFAGTAVIFGFNDTTTSSTSVTDTLWVKNASGQFQLYTHTFHTGPYGTIVDTIPCNDVDCNPGTASNLYVQLSYTDVFGTQGVSLGVTGGSISTVPNIDSGILGWDVIFGSVTPLTFASYFLILMAAAISGVYSAKFGTIVVSGVIGGLTYLGWFTPGAGLVMFVATIAVTSFVAYLEAGR